MEKVKVKSIERTKDNLKEGIQEFYHYNGKLKIKSENKNGHQNGDFVSYDSYGKLSLRKSYIYLEKEDKSVLNGVFEQYLLPETKTAQFSANKNAQKMENKSA